MFKKYLKYKSKYEIQKLKLRDNINFIKDYIADECNNSECPICFDLFDGTIYKIIQLECGCCMHEKCLIGYIKNALGYRSDFTTDGIKCPLKPNEHIRISAKKIQDFLRPKDLNSMSASKFDERTNLTDEELEKFHQFQIIEKVEISVSNDDLSEQINKATSKPCPNCRIPTTHFHGHGCHHVIDGCFNCKTEYCWRCGSTAEDNIKERGRSSRCKCDGGSWTTFCKNEDILDNIVLNEFGYPIDKRCGCPICNQCLRGEPCSDLCDGDCVVCKGLVAQGPNEISKFKDYKKEALNEDELLFQILGYYIVKISSEEYDYDSEDDDYYSEIIICCVNIETNTKYEIELSEYLNHDFFGKTMRGNMNVKRVNEFKKSFDFIPISDAYFNMDIDNEDDFSCPYFNYSEYEGFNITKDFFRPASLAYSPRAMTIPREAERREAERLHQERLHQERLLQERLHQERLLQERLLQERLQQERLQQERLQQERERERRQQERERWKELQIQKEKDAKESDIELERRREIYERQQKENERREIVAEKERREKFFIESMNPKTNNSVDFSSINPKPSINQTRIFIKHNWKFQDNRKPNNPKKEYSKENKQILDEAVFNNEHMITIQETYFIHKINLVTNTIEVLNKDGKLLYNATLLTL